MIIDVGSFFGEYEVIYNLKREYSVRAKTDCIVLVLKKKNYLQML
jgi:CRP-like cAMP-binding protein